MSQDRPSPFTIPEPDFRFDKGSPDEPRPVLAMSFGMLIQNLRRFADFYEQATAAIEAAEGAFKVSQFAHREAYANDLREQCLATKDIDRIRTLSLSRLGEELTVRSAERLLGELIRSSGGTLTAEQASSLSLGEAADRLGHTPTSATTQTVGSNEYFVTLDQAAALVNKSKRTLERLKKRMPKPRVVGRRGQAAEWAWSELRPWLEAEFGRTLPDTPPRVAGR